MRWAVTYRLWENVSWALPNQRFGSLGILSSLKRGALPTHYSDFKEKKRGTFGGERGGAKATSIVL